MNLKRSSNAEKATNFWHFFVEKLILIQKFTMKQLTYHTKTEMNQQ